MQQKVTFRNAGRFLRGLAVLMLMSFVTMAVAQPYSNGPLSTGATSSNGVAAPAGYTWSEVQGTNLNAGFSASITAGVRLGDDFIVPAGQTWSVSSLVFYGYQTGYASTTVSPFTTVRVTIHSGSITGPVVFGDQTTNRFASSANANMYRIFNATPGTTRIIWSITATAVVSLPAGTYWIEYATDVTGGAAHFLPSKTVVGTTTQAGNNAMQNTGAGWVALTDVGPQDMPFLVNYTTGPVVACTGTPAPGNTISTATSVCPNTPFTLSVQNATTGSGVTYQWQSGPSATGPFTAIAGATSATYTVTNLTATTFYRLAVTCAGNTAFSTPVQVSATPTSSCYCIPPNADCTDGDIITRVVLGTLNNASTCSAPTGYSNYTVATPALTVPDVIRGANNPISVTAGGGLFTESVAVWIDFNQSGTFEASEFTLVGATTGGTLTQNIAVPATALLGQTRMRVRVQFSQAIVATGACTASYLGFGETEDYTVNIVPCTPVTITSQPQNATISCSGTATFSVTASGSLPTYQWQYRQGTTGAFIPVPNAAPFSGVNTATLTVSNAPVSLNGYQFRVAVGGACSSVENSNPANLTVNPYTLLVTPASGSICSTGGTPVLLTVPATTDTLRFTNSTAGVIPDFANNPNTPAGMALVYAGINRTFNVTGVTGTILSARVRLNIAHPYVSDLAITLKAPNNNILNLDYFLTSTGAAGANFTNTIISSIGTVALNTTAAPHTAVHRADAVITPLDPTVPTGPTNFEANVTTWASLLGTPNGTWTLAMYDGGATDEGTFTNATLEIITGAPPASATFTPTTGLFTNPAGTTPYTGTAVTQVYAAPTATTTYTANVTNGTCTATPQAITITVNTLPTGPITVASRTVCAGQDATFTATTPTGGPQLSYQWQMNTPAAPTFVNIAGATSNTYTVTAATTAMSGNQYRLVVSSTGCSATLISSAGTLTVNPKPVVVISAAPVRNLFPGLTTTLTAAVSPNAAVSYQWLLNGNPVAGATSNMLTVGVDGRGSYTVRVTDVNGCTNTATTPASITIGDSTTDILFIYPSPNNGRFQVRYFSDANNGQRAPTFLSVYDSKGQRVYYRRYTLGFGYQQMGVDLGSHGKGIYRVDLLDTQGDRIKTGSVMVF